MLYEVVLLVGGIALVLWLANRFAYGFLKERMLRRRVWDLNICCGKTNGGGVNADIVRHAEVPNFVLLDDIYHLPFKDNQFETVLCSHTIEHVEDPERFYTELRRVGKEVHLSLPPMWDVGAALNIFEHRWLFLTLKTEHIALPSRVPLPLARSVQKIFGQSIRA